MEHTDHEQALPAIKTVCKNCSNTFSGRYCNNCAQAANTHSINFHFLLNDIQQSVFDIDKGFVFTVKELYTRPGFAIREFIDGKRVVHFKPFALVLLLAGIYGFLYHYFDINAVPKFGERPEIDKFSAEVNEWMATHYALAEIILIPFAATGSYIMFRKWRYNYIQNLVISLFLTAQRLVLSIVLFPLIYFYRSANGLSLTITLIIGLLLYLWSYVQLFNDKPKFKTGVKAVLAYILSYVIMTFVSGVGGVIAGIFMKVLK